MVVTPLADQLFYCIVKNKTLKKGLFYLKKSENLLDYVYFYKDRMLAKEIDKTDITRVKNKQMFL